MEFFVGRMTTMIAVPPSNTVMSFHVILVTSLARAPHTRERRKRQASRRSSVTRVSSDSSNGMMTSSRNGLVLRGRRTPAALFQCLWEMAIASCKRLIQASAEPSPPTTSGQILAHVMRAERHCEGVEGGVVTYTRMWICVRTHGHISHPARHIVRQADVLP